ncbi:hypothetical protein N7520_002636 [Penicillium odoratum]|uniref:uncharacterized protein n=1 Tax=Penicillium odoratum TaxID=1167516 RepID=UPI0025481FB3|nr:uncharacterized protein N7520_002636 [Penicillium odoratum]KAJ5772107.1 hypothetical protein N7520_002636 [Penicillium odoratum]
MAHKQESVPSLPGDMVPTFAPDTLLLMLLTDLDQNLRYKILNKMHQEIEGNYQELTWKIRDMDETEDVAKKDDVEETRMDDEGDQGENNQDKTNDGENKNRVDDD